MGKVVFSPCSGAVEIARPSCDSTSVLTIDIDGPINAIVTGMTLEMSGNYQFLHTLNDLVYFYSFGDRVGSLTLTGISFIKNCRAGAGAGVLLPKKSIMDLYQYYLDNRAVKSDGLAKSIVLTGDSKSIKLWGFLTGVRLDMSDSQMGTVGYWSMRFEVLPQK